MHEQVPSKVSSPRIDDDWWVWHGLAAGFFCQTVALDGPVLHY